MMKLLVDKIPASAGMTVEVAGMTSGGSGDDSRGSGDDKWG